MFTGLVSVKKLVSQMASDLRLRPTKRSLLPCILLLDMPVVLRSPCDSKFAVFSLRYATWSYYLAKSILFYMIEIN